MSMIIVQPQQLHSYHCAPVGATTQSARDELELVLVLMLLRALHVLLRLSCGTVHTKTVGAHLR